MRAGEFANVGPTDVIEDDPYQTDAEYLDLPRNSGLRLGWGYRFASEWDVTWNEAGGVVDRADDRVFGTVPGP